MTLAIIDNAFLSLIGTAIPASTVVLLAALGAMIGERVGVLNLGQEGLIGIGAVYAVIAVNEWDIGSPWVALLIGMIAAGVAGAIFAVSVVVFKANQVLAGLALALGGIGLSNQLGSGHNGSTLSVGFSEVNPGGAFDDG
ncbi:MAG: hypothetical protein KDB21_00080, partial [Acidimicrobiales bacterium]|nr:hypothetical protein [Acidimicrobiales bacterium]